MMAWRFWSGRRDRLALAMIGALVLGVGLSVIALLSGSVMGTVVEVYSESARAPYDILVYAPRANGEPLPDLLPPNDLLNLTPGIRPEQVEAIRHIPGVALAAPLAVVGFIELGPGKFFPRYDPEGPVSPPRRWPPGVYRVTETVRSDRAGLNESFSRTTWVAASDNGVLPVGAPDGISDYYAAGIPPDWDSLQPAYAVAPAPVLLVGVDPGAEAALLGMDQAVTEGRYFAPSDAVRSEDRLAIPIEEVKETNLRFDDPNLLQELAQLRKVRVGQDFYIPVLVNTRALDGVRAEFVVERMGPEGRPVDVAFRVVHEGLDIIRASLGAGWQDDDMTYWREGYVRWRGLLGRTTLLPYDDTVSPFPSRWPRAVRLRSLDATPLSDAWDSSRIVNAYYERNYFSLRQARFIEVDPRITDTRKASFGRVYRSFQLPHRSAAAIFPEVVGYFDPQRLAVSKDAKGRPLETYRPAEATLVLDPQGRPVNPPQTVQGGLTPTDFLTSPPVFVTTLEAALKIEGEDAINAVRVKIEGSEQITPETIARARDIARTIEEQTGLVARVTMGAAPARVLIEVPESNGHPALGWVEDVWLDLSGAVTAVEQAEFGHGAFVVVALVVGLLYAVATALTGVTARRRELGVAAAVGWPGRALGRLAVGEQALLGGAVGLMAALAAAMGGLPAGAVGLILLAGPVLYLPAMVAAGWAVRDVAPGEALRWGDVAPGRRVLPGSGIVPLAVASLFGRPGRTLLTGLAVALPTGLILLLSHIALHLRGVLYTTITGEYAALKVGPIQYAIGVVALVVAAVTAFDLIRQNAIDHRAERALLHALGWPRGWIGRLMVAEGALLGLLAGVAGDLLGMGVVGLLYGTGGLQAWRTALWVWLVPVGLGALTGWLSALLELRSWGWQALAGVEAGQVLRDGRWWRWAFWAGVLALLGAAVALIAAGGIR